MRVNNAALFARHDTNKMSCILLSNMEFIGGYLLIPKIISRVDVSIAKMKRLTVPSVPVNCVGYISHNKASARANIQSGMKIPSR